MFRRFDIRRGEGNGENEMSRTIISLPNELECCSAYNILLPGYQMILNLKWEIHSQVIQNVTVYIVINKYTCS